MRKIRKYKVNIRPTVVLRLLNRIFSVSSSKPDIEEQIHSETELITKKVIPATIYETYFWPGFPPPLVNISQEKNISGLTLAATTLGEVEKELFSGLTMNDILYQIRHCILLEFLEQAANFVSRIIPEETKENILLVKNERIEDPAKRIAFGKLLSLEKINLKIEEGRFVPGYSMMNLFYWQVQRRK